MKIFARISTVALFLGAGILSACSGTSNVLSPRPSPTSTPIVAGDYTGSISDSLRGGGTAAATLAQHGANLGGELTSTFGTTNIEMFVSATLDASNNFAGEIIQDAPVTCVFTLNGSYNTSTNQLTGSYGALTGCSGQNGNFTLTQQCIDQPTARRAQPISGPRPC